jgi:hypothetical protein
MYLVCGSFKIKGTMKSIFMKSRVFSAVTGALLLTMSFESIAQSNYFNSSRNWAFNRKEVYFGIAASNFLGDLGGGKGEGRQKSPADLDYQSTRAGINGGFRYRFSPRFATKTNLNFSLVSGDDKYTDEVFRNSRNLHFRSLILEVSQQLEFIFWYSENIKYAKSYNGYYNNSSQAYLFAGVGAFWFNPKAKYNGEWLALRPLGTEGQNMADGPAPYGPISYSVPMGIGFKTTISQFWRLGFEIAYHKTFTDYIDDASGYYYHNFAALAANNPLSLALADRHIANSQWFKQGVRRANPEDNDALVYFNIHAIYNLSYEKGPLKAKRSRAPKTKF